MADRVNAEAIPGAGGLKKKETLEKIELKNVRFDGGMCDVTAEIVPFDAYNDEHVDFAFAYNDMMYRAPSQFRNVSDAAKGYVEVFMKHTAEDAANRESDFSKVRNDVRAARTLLHNEKFMLAMDRFFVNA